MNDYIDKDLQENGLCFKYYHTTFIEELRKTDKGLSQEQKNEECEGNEANHYKAITCFTCNPE
jgi:hypothetical protein